MAYPYSFLKVTFGGNIYAGADIWVNSMNFGQVASDIGFETGDWGTKMTELATAVSIWFQDNKTNISLHAQLEWVKLAYINKDGHYFREPDIFDFSAPIQGGALHTSAPQNTLAITFQTSKLRAPGRFGRIYPPLNVGPVGTDGMADAATAESMALSTTTLINSMSNVLTQAGEEQIRLIVASQKTDRNYSVSNIKVGRVVDTQRSRRNAFNESYSVLHPIA